MSNKLINFGLALSLATFGLTALADETDYNFSGLKVHQFEGKTSQDLTNEEIISVLEEMPVFLNEVARTSEARANYVKDKVSSSGGKFFSVSFTGESDPSGTPQMPIGSNNYNQYLDQAKSDKDIALGYAKSMECAHGVFVKTNKKMIKEKKVVHFSEVKALSSLSGWKGQRNIITPCKNGRPTPFGFRDYEATVVLKKYRKLLNPWI